MSSSIPIVSSGESSHTETSIQLPAPPVAIAPGVDGVVAGVGR